MHVRFERSDGMLESIHDVARGANEAARDSTTLGLTQWVVLGPFEWVQLTYRELRASPEGEPIARLEGDAWYLIGTARNGIVSLHASEVDIANPFSDIVVY